MHQENHICKEYKKYHSTALHGYQYKKQNNASGKRKKLSCQIGAQK